MLECFSVKVNLGEPVWIDLGSITVFDDKFRALGAGCSFLAFPWVTVMRPLLYSGIAAALVAFASSVFWSHATKQRSEAAQSLSDKRISDSGAEPGDWPDAVSPELFPVHSAAGNSLASQSSDLSERLNLRRVAAFADFHQRQKAEFSAIDSSFGMMRVTEMQIAQNMNHSTFDRRGLFKLEESDSLAKVSPIEAKPSVGEYKDHFDHLDLPHVPAFPVVDEFLSMACFKSVPCDRSIRVTVWKLVRMELIGLIKHATPVAYVAREIPRMGELNSVPTTELNDFEHRAIKHLKSNPNQDVAIHNAPDGIQLVGALRAEKACAKCHSVKNGDLLGALTYRFELDGEAVDEYDLEITELQQFFLADVSVQRAAEQMPFSSGGKIRITTEPTKRLEKHGTTFSPVSAEAVKSPQIHFPLTETIEGK